MPAANQNVIVSKNYAPNDFSFVSLGNMATQTVKSDSTGKVIVQLYPGALPGPVEIKATLANDTSVTALSKNVSVASGRATQNGLSISMTKNVLENDVDGDTTDVTIRLVDRVGNAVPNGTVVSFVAEGGAIEPNCSTNAGVCTVKFTTQNPRTADGRVSVLAYLEGDKSYNDVNGDNQYTVGVDKLINNIGDLFRDDNENGLFDVGEFVYKRGASGTCTPSIVSFTQPNIAGTCDSDLAGILRHQFVIGMAKSTPTFVTLLNDPMPNSLSASLSRYSFKMYGNFDAQNKIGLLPMPSGTTIAITTKDNTKDNKLSCTAELVAGVNPVSAINNLSNKTVADSNVQYSFTMQECAASDEIRITVSTPAPNAVTTTHIIPLT